jgi:hypothetical protein
MVNLRYHSFMLQTNPLTLTELRNSRQVGVREVARRMGVPHPTVLRFEDFGVGNLETMEKYAEALELPFPVVHEASLETRRRRQALVVA